MIRQYIDCGVVECDACGVEIETVRAYGAHEVTARHYCCACETADTTPPPASGDDAASADTLEDKR